MRTEPNMIPVTPTAMPGLLRGCRDYLTNPMPGSTFNDYTEELRTLSNPRMLFVDSDLLDGMTVEEVHEAIRVPEFFTPGESYFILYDKPVPGFRVRQILSGSPAIPGGTFRSWPVQGLFVRIEPNPHEGEELLFVGPHLLINVGSANRDAARSLARRMKGTNLEAFYRTDARNRSPILPVTEQGASVTLDEPWTPEATPSLTIFPDGPGKRIVPILMDLTIAAVNRAGRTGVETLPADNRALQRKDVEPRKDRPEPEVVVVSIRPRWRHDTVNPRHVDWKYRWRVRPHWTTQAYGPNRSLRKRILIDGYLKGPKDKPIRGSKVVYKA